MSYEGYREAAAPDGTSEIDAIDLSGDGVDRPVEEGWYVVEIGDYVRKIDASGRVQTIVVGATIAEGPHKGVDCKDVFSFKNKNGRKAFRNLAIAAGAVVTEEGPQKGWPLSRKEHFLGRKFEALLKWHADGFMANTNRIAAARPLGAGAAPAVAGTPGLATSPARAAAAPVLR